MNEQILEKVKCIMAAQLGVEAAQVVPQAKFIEDLGLDSLDTADLVIIMEEKFGVYISVDDADNLETVGKLVDYLEEHADHE